MQKPSGGPLANMEEIGIDEIARRSIRQLHETVEKSTGKTAAEIQNSPLGNNEEAVVDISPHPRVITSKEVDETLKTSLRED